MKNLLFITTKRAVTISQGRIKYVSLHFSIFTLTLLPLCGRVNTDKDASSVCSIKTDCVVTFTVFNVRYFSLSVKWLSVHFAWINTNRQYVLGGLCNRAVNFARCINKMFTQLPNKFCKFILNWQGVEEQWKYVQNFTNRISEIFRVKITYSINVNNGFQNYKHIIFLCAIY